MAEIDDNGFRLKIKYHLFKKGWQAMRLRYIPTYRDVENHRQLQFIPLDLIYDKNTPGFTHRVFIDNCPKDWLSQEYNPNTKSAEFYFGKYPPQRFNESLGQKVTVKELKGEKNGIL